MLGPAAVSVRDTSRLARRRAILEAAWAVARQRGVASVTMRVVADRVGMRAPSLYEYFGSKEAIYDAMFAEGYDEFLATMPGPDDPEDPVERAATWLRRFFSFCREDVARYQLLFQRSIPGFRPSADSLRRARRPLAVLAEEFRLSGIRRPQAADLWTALVTGMVNQQVVNDPGGDRWEQLIDEAAAMFMDHAYREEELP